MQPSISADDAIYNQIEPPAPLERPPMVITGNNLTRFLHHLNQSGALSIRGQIISAWITCLQGHVIFIGSGDVQLLAAYTKLPVKTVRCHCRAISNHPITGAYLHYQGANK